MTAVTIVLIAIVFLVTIYYLFFKGLAAEFDSHFPEEEQTCPCAHIYQEFPDYTTAIEICKECGEQYDEYLCS